MTPAGERASHWDDTYATRGAQEVSWFQPEPTVSLEIVRELEVDRSTPVIDVGGGASVLVDRLLSAGFDDITVLDISEVALATARNRTGEIERVTWLQEDVLAWKPGRRYGLWHDRAAFHFLTTPHDRDAYVNTMSCALRPGGFVVVATFAGDGPEYCSGLPVARYTADDLVAVLGRRFCPRLTRREEHTTPAGVLQPFTWVAGTFSPPSSG